MSYTDRRGDDSEQGAAIQVRDLGGEVQIELGVMRNFGSISADAWAALTPNEARELAGDLQRAARSAEAKFHAARGAHAVEG